MQISFQRVKTIFAPGPNRKNNVPLSGKSLGLLIVAALWYLILVSILSVVQFFIERHYLKGWQAEIHVPLQA